MDLSKDLPEAVCLNWEDEEWIQKIDYEQLSFKCRNCHEHGHFQRNYPKAQREDKEEGEVWQKFKKGKAATKPAEKKTTGHPEKLQPKPANKDAP